MAHVREGGEAALNRGEKVVVIPVKMTGGLFIGARGVGISLLRFAPPK
jgi:hypothetical protein